MVSKYTFKMIKKKCSIDSEETTWNTIIDSRISSLSASVKGWDASLTTIALVIHRIIFMTVVWSI